MRTCEQRGVVLQRRRRPALAGQRRGLHSIQGRPSGQVPRRRTAQHNQAEHSRRCSSAAGVRKTR